jgi:hypothetical protein
MYGLLSSLMNQRMFGRSGGAALAGAATAAAAATPALPARKPRRSSLVCSTSTPTDRLLDWRSY